jgi:hypothetical protein
MGGRQSQMASGLTQGGRQSSEAAAKEDRANSKIDETVVVGLASWPPTRALVTKALQDLVKKKKKNTKSQIQVCV